MAVAILFCVLWVLSKQQIKIVRTESRAEISRMVSVIEEKDTEIEGYRLKYSSVFDQEATLFQMGQEEAGLSLRIDQLRSSYSEKKAIFDRLEAQVAVYDERLSFAELGVYEPHFDFNDSEAFKRRIKQVQELQKILVSEKTALQCPTAWTVDGSVSKGQVMINRQVRLSLRAFNNECGVAIANVRWNNVNAMEKRILAAEKAINRENGSMNIVINDSYVQLKIEELRLTHEYREQLKKEKDERAELARAEREEKRLLAEAEAAEREERKFQVLLDKARKAAGVDEARISELEAALAEARENSERAHAMAEMTQSGYVYIISNVGSFGNDVVKIGLTRRLNPDDRVRELGDASVPFTFDTHAMIYSEEAPALESALHKEFADRRINMVNMRKEFFCVTIEEVEEAVSRLAPNASFFKDREAQEWHETLARRNQMLEDLQWQGERFPAEL
ncbi:DUF4041 domain-containing protein [Ruficoccus sp. ZRK36]|uniref:DUF4041 domain-containing protein n=1 Tax=Ruficoccus sp. ZRK36 TaxID=2866311 RepID=UPI001C7384CA|nr:DUF4041 domain-containing protein [Ruficoccus sp. ZRK36]QYY37213.1 DUF4041 domain-containing protein [Ruficoccus sp. ZRK36]